MVTDAPASFDFGTPFTGPARSLRSSVRSTTTVPVASRPWMRVAVLPGSAGRGQRGAASVDERRRRRPCATRRRPAVPACPRASPQTGAGRRPRLSGQTEVSLGWSVVVVAVAESSTVVVVGLSVVVVVVGSGIVVVVGPTSS